VRETIFRVGEVVFSLAVVLELQTVVLAALPGQTVQVVMVEREVVAQVMAGMVVAGQLTAAVLVAMRFPALHFSGEA
jgi:hypothetical protein